MRPLRDVMRTRLRLVQQAACATNSVLRLLEKYNVRTVAELSEFSQLQAACHQELP